MAASAKAAKMWKQLKKQLKVNRTGKKRRGVNSIFEKGELVLQYLTAEVIVKSRSTIE